MSRYIDIETIKPRQYENSEVELGVLAYDYDEVDAMPFLDIVQCGECKHRGDDHWFCCNLNLSSDAESFCSFGERKESKR